MDTLFGQGWPNRLMATGKFEVISNSEAVKISDNKALLQKVFIILLMTQHT
jgi:hypothetical protein